MNPTITASIFQFCDFCQTRGILGKTIADRDGWYFCKPCLTEIERELERRKSERLAGRRDELAV